MKLGVRLAPCILACGHIWRHIVFCTNTILGMVPAQIAARRLSRRPNHDHCSLLLQRIRRGFEELGEAILVDGLFVGLFRRNPFLGEEILNRVIQGLHADVLPGLHG